jgi:Peptidase family M28/PA domain
LHFAKFSQMLVFFILTSCIFLFSQPALSLKNNSYIYVKSNLEFLASDELEGREATTRGEKLAALFISEELEKYGILPFGDNGSYYQDFNMIVSRFSRTSNATFLNGSDDLKVFTNGSDVVYSSRSLPSNDFNNREYEILFVGYGIFSEEDNYDSYENINVEGKVVLLINGTPKQDGKEFLSKRTLAKYKRLAAKTKLAQSKGAIGVIVFPNEETLIYWDYMKTWATSKSFKLEEEIDTSGNKNIPTLMLNDKSAAALLLNEEQNYKALKELIIPRPESFKLESKISFEYDIIAENKMARNIIGLIRGNDESLKNEYLTLGAHYDHEGIKKGEIYNGADDNGSGTVTILEVARRLAFNNDNERPTIIIFHTAEEKGLKGAKYLANNSEFIGDVIGHINLDMVGRKSEDSIYCIGASKLSSELGEIVEEVNSKTTNFVLDYKFDDPNDSQRLYYRSDHIHYANKGIPIAFFYDYMKKDYHKPTDTVDKINFSKIIKMVDFIYELTLQISNLDHKLTVDDLSTID